MGELDVLPVVDTRMRLIDISCSSQDAIPSAIFSSLRGTLIATIDSSAILTSGSLERAVHAFVAHPDWLLVCGDREFFDGSTGFAQRHICYSDFLQMQGLTDRCDISIPAVVFRRSLAVLLGLFHHPTQKPFDLAFLHSALHSAFDIFPHRVGCLPHLQLQTFSYPFSEVHCHQSAYASEVAALTGCDLGAAPASTLNNYVRDFHTVMPDRLKPVRVHDHLVDLAAQTVPWLDPEALIASRNDRYFDPDIVAALSLCELHAAAHQPPRLLPLRLLLAEHPELLLNAQGPPTGPNLRFQQAVYHFSVAYPLLQGASSSSELVSFAERPFGVNLVGHAYEVFGIGEDIRMAARALQAAGVPCAVIYQPAANGSACTDHSLQPLLCVDPSGGPYAFNLVCMTAPSQARWLLKAGLDPLRERFTLTAWPWETQQWPKAWLPLLEVADELWPSSTFTAAALQEPAAAASVPLHVMPMAASITNPDLFCSPVARRAARARHDLPADVVLFGFSFDLNSSAIRKNPMGALEAFQLAFPLPELPASFGREINCHPLSNQVALMIKTFPPLVNSHEWNWLQLRAAEDPRIHLVVARLERDELIALYGCCDVFLSLHRSEGFGRGIAEALQLGLDVITTGYGGNVDFCTSPLAHSVRFKTVPIPHGTYPFADGHYWAEPDLEHAAALMQEVAARRRVLDLDPTAASFNPSCDPDVLASYRERFSYASAGFRYRARLEALWSQRRTLASQLKWKVDTPV